ncbi:MAG TPA: hypothetical protein VGB53_13620 [Rubricoccaceae bacterium]
MPATLDNAEHDNVNVRQIGIAGQPSDVDGSEIITAGAYYEFDPVYAVAPPRPLVGFALLLGDVSLTTQELGSGEQTMENSFTTVGTDIPLSMFFRRSKGASVLQRFRFNLATELGDPGRYVFTGLSLSTLVLGARSGEIPLDIIPAYRFGPGGDSLSRERVSFSFQFDVGTVLKEAKGALGL